MDLAEPFFDDTLGFSSEQKERILEVEKERLTTLQDLSQQTGVYSTIPPFEKNLLVWKKADEQDALYHLRQIETILREADEQTFKEQSLIEGLIKKYIEVSQYQNGNVLWPLRVALSGQAQSAGPFELVWVLGKDESIKRIQQAIQKLIS
jgi:glutamyl/glutaminyl-tRNA synthetase